MYSARLVQLLLVALAFICLAQASVVYNARGIQVRQDDGDDDISSILPIPGDDDDDDDTPTSAPPSAAPTSAAPTVEPTTSVEDPVTTTTEEVTSETTTAVDETTSEIPVETTSSEAEPTSSAPEETTAATTTREEEPSSTAEESSSEEPQSTRKAITSTSIEVVTRTKADGSEETLTSSTITIQTGDPDAEGSGNNGDGLSKSTRDIIIGVVVGIGGAILLGALGVVAWRIRARKRAAEEDADLMGEYNGGYTQVDKSEPPSSATGTVPSSGGQTQSPFQSTLENYHQPTQPVNASSNF